MSYTVTPEDDVLKSSSPATPTKAIDYQCIFSVFGHIDNFIKTYIIQLTCQGQTHLKYFRNKAIKI